MNNSVTLIGYVGNTPETRDTASGSKLATLSLATSRILRGEGGKPRLGDDGKPITETAWHRITCFDAIAKSVTEHVAKGMKIVVTGRLRYSRWTDKDGVERTGSEIVARSVDFLPRPREATADTSTSRRRKAA